jgi:hypothetical protein
VIGPLALPFNNVAPSADEAQHEDPEPNTGPDRLFDVQVAPKFVEVKILAVEAAINLLPSAEAATPIQNTTGKLFEIHVTPAFVEVKIPLKYALKAAWLPAAAIK